MGAVHAHAARAAGAELVGIAASSLESAERARTALGARAAYRGVESLLDAGLDVLHVCAPNALHFDLALAAVRAGVNIVCEKPITTTVGEAALLTREAAERGLVGTVPFVYRFHPMVRELRSRVASGGAGRIALVSGSYLQDWLADAGATNWRVDPAQGGASRTFADIGSHWFDLLEFVLDTRVVRLSAQFATLFAHRPSDFGAAAVSTEDTVTVQFVTAAGALGSFSASQVARGRKNRLSLEISGDQHSFFFDQENPESLWQGDSEGGRVIVRDPGTLSREAARLSYLPAGHAQGYQDCFNAYVADTYAAVRGEEPEGIPRFRDGLRSTIVVDAVIRSAGSAGSWVDVPDVESVLS